ARGREESGGFDPSKLENRFEVSLDEARGDRLEKGELVQLLERDAGAKLQHGGIGELRKDLRNGVAGISGFATDKAVEDVFEGVAGRQVRANDAARARPDKGGDFHGFERSNGDARCLKTT